MKKRTKEEVQKNNRQPLYDRNTSVDDRDLTSKRDLNKKRKED